MAAFDTLLNDPVAQMGYGLLVAGSPGGTMQQGFGAALDLMQQGQQQKIQQQQLERQARQDKMEEKLFDLKVKEASLPDISYDFNPVTGEYVATNQRTGEYSILPLGGDKGAQPSDGRQVPLPAQTLSPKAFAEYEKNVAKNTADKYAAYESSKSKLPELINTVNKLSGLAEDATYTLVGQGVDEVARQFGYTTEGGKARTTYESIVSNQVLPLLRDTFGAAFTAAEGESLRKTLGDPDKTPEEKNEVLGAFIRQKMNNIKSSSRELGLDSSFLDQLQPRIQIGGGPEQTAPSGFSIRRIR